jgi:serine/threonine protein kinase
MGNLNIQQPTFNIQCSSEIQMSRDPLDGEKTILPDDKTGGYALAVGQTLGQYRIVRPLGRGGMGEVYEVEHETLERRYALKLLPTDFAGQPGALERFRREAKVMARLEHPNILKVDDFGETGGGIG